MTDQQDTAENTVKIDIDSGITGAQTIQTLQSHRSITSIFTNLLLTRHLDLDGIIDAADTLRTVHDKVEINAPDAELPDILAQYQEGERVAEGGQATIDKAKDRYLHRTVAVKHLKKEFWDKESERNAFIREAQLTSQLDHPAIIPIYQLAKDQENGLAIAMKLVQGLTLKERIAKISSIFQNKGAKHFDNKKSLNQRLDLFLKVCDAISYAHAKGIMHCDLKPENIMIGKFHEAYIMDWGISEPIPEKPDPDFRRTQISGTPKYLSPEAIKGKQVDGRGDIFALGLILFEMVTLQQAVIGTKSDEILKNTREGRLKPVRHKYGLPIPTDLKAIIEKAIAPDRNKRYQTVDRLSDDIRKFIAGEEISARKLSWTEKRIRTAQKYPGRFIVTTLLIILFGLCMTVFNLWDMHSKSVERELRTKLTWYAYKNTNSNALGFDKIAMAINRSIHEISELSSVITPKNEEELKKIFPELRHIFLSTALLPASASAESLPFHRIRTIWLDNELSLDYYASGEYEVNSPNVEWYWNALKTRAAVWSRPYFVPGKAGIVVSFTMPFYTDKGNAKGAASMELALGPLAQYLRNTGNHPEYTIDKYLVDLNGKILICKAYNGLFKETSDGQPELLQFGPEKIWNEICERKIGYFFNNEREEMLYLFVKLETFPGYYIEKISVSRLKLFLEKDKNKGIEEAPVLDNEQVPEQESAT